MGFLLAQSASYGLQLMGDEKMDAWGWRLPFLVAILPGSIATMGRRCMPESGLFLEAQQVDAEASEASSAGGGCEGLRKMRQLLRSHWANILVGIGGVVSASVLQYGGFVWCSVRLQKVGAEPLTLLSAGIVARVSAIVFVPLAAWLADLQGVAWMHLVGSLMLTFFGLPLYMAMLENYMSFTAVVAAYGLGLSLRKSGRDLETASFSLPKRHLQAFAQRFRVDLHLRWHVLLPLRGGTLPGGCAERRGGP